MNSQSERNYILELGRILKKHRESQNITQNQLAYEAEVNRKHIYYIEIGKVNPGVETLIKICEILNLKLSDLLKEVGK